MGDYEVVYVDGEEETSNWISRPGKVKITYANGDVFEGLVDDRKLKHGKNCTYTFAPSGPLEEEEESRCVYKGEYTDGHRTGVGAMQYADGSNYRGQFVQGFRHGIGSYTYANQDIYSGEWKNDKREGKGTYLSASTGTRLDATWVNNEPVEGTFIHPDGTTYNGTWANGKFSGSFEISFPSSIKLQGEFFEKIIPGKKKGQDTFQDRWRPCNAETKERIEADYVEYLQRGGKWP